MRTGSAITVLGVGLLSHLVSAIPECQDPQVALQWFNYNVPVPVQCVDQLSAQATAFCQNYLALDPVTSYLSTVTQDTSSVTVSETSTTLTTSTETITTTAPTTSTEITTETATTTSTSIVNEFRKRGAGPTCQLYPSNCINLATDCLDLTEANLLRRPASALDEYCRCLGIAATTVTVEASTATGSTSTTTETTVETDVVSETSTLTEVDLTVTTQTTTLTNTATTTSTVVGP
ncbi:hypothetical protein BR93DRAFT_298817 [Coniochaeta sp. PMI_546]|nr:hypothetical protein BR93DRAFT_298817 [Coniochaeta sp. PMI_546]